MKHDDIDADIRDDATALSRRYHAEADEQPGPDLDRHILAQASAATSTPRSRRHPARWLATAATVLLSAGVLTLIRDEAPQELAPGQIVAPLTTERASPPVPGPAPPTTAEREQTSGVASTQQPAIETEARANAGQRRALAPPRAGLDRAEPAPIPEAFADKAESSVAETRSLAETVPSTRREKRAAPRAAPATAVPACDTRLPALAIDDYWGAVIEQRVQDQRRSNTLVCVRLNDRPWSRIDTAAVDNPVLQHDSWRRWVEATITSLREPLTPTPALRRLQDVTGVTQTSAAAWRDWWRQNGDRLRLDGDRGRLLATPP